MNPQQGEGISLDLGLQILVLERKLGEAVAEAARWEAAAMGLHRELLAAAEEETEAPGDDG